MKQIYILTVALILILLGCEPGQQLPAGDLPLPPPPRPPGATAQVPRILGLATATTAPWAVNCIQFNPDGSCKDVNGDGTITIKDKTPWAAEPSKGAITLAPLNPDLKFDKKNRELTVTITGYDLIWPEGYHTDTTYILANINKLDPKLIYKGFEVRDLIGNPYTTRQGWIVAQKESVAMQIDASRFEENKERLNAVMLYACNLLGVKSGFVEYDCNGIDAKTVKVKADGKLATGSGIGSWLLKDFEVAGGTVPPPPPPIMLDLVVGPITISANPTVGQPVTFTVDVVNNGNVIGALGDIEFKSDITDTNPTAITQKLPDFTSAGGTFPQGTTTTLTFNGKDYTVEVLSIAATLTDTSIAEASIRINGETIPKSKTGDIANLADRTLVVFGGIKIGTPSTVEIELKSSARVSFTHTYTTPGNKEAQINILTSTRDFVPGNNIQTRTITVADVPQTVATTATFSYYYPYSGTPYYVIGTATTPATIDCFTTGTETACTKNYQGTANQEYNGEIRPSIDWRIKEVQFYRGATVTAASIPIHTAQCSTVNPICTAAPCTPCTFTVPSIAYTETGPYTAKIIVTQTIPVPTAKITVIKEPTNTGTGTVEEDATTKRINCGTTCTTQFVNLAPTTGTVTLRATPASGSVFMGWEGDVDAACKPATGPVPTCTVTAGAASTEKKVTAVFDTDTRARLTVSILGQASGKITSPATAAGDTVEWTGLDCGIKCSGTAKASVSPSVTLTATPDAGAVLAGWGGDVRADICQPATGPVPTTCTGVFGAAGTTKRITASFEPAEGTLTVEKVALANGIGTVTSTSTAGTATTQINCGTTCSTKFKSNPATEVTLTATPGTDSTFYEWEGCTPQANPNICKVTIDTAATKTVKAVFKGKTTKCLIPLTNPFTATREFWTAKICDPKHGFPCTATATTEANNACTAMLLLGKELPSTGTPTKTGITGINTADIIARITRLTFVTAGLQPQEALECELPCSHAEANNVNWCKDLVTLSIDHPSDTFSPASQAADQYFTLEPQTKCSP